MIYVTGDCHSDFKRFSSDNFPEQKGMTKDDYVIICGDFGGVWYSEKSRSIKEEKYWLDWLNDKPFTTLFVDGNHENFDRLYSFDEEQWHGGKVHKIRDSVLHLMRGEIFDVDGRKIFAFGGASSHDIADGVLDPVKDEGKILRWYKDYSKQFRIKGISWWEQELPTAEEMDNGLKNLAAAGNSVDFVFTHCAPSMTQLFIDTNFANDRLTEYLEKVRCTIDYKKWFFGHYHEDKNVNSNDIALYEQIIRIN